MVLSAVLGAGCGRQVVGDSPVGTATPTPTSTLTGTPTPTATPTPVVDNDADGLDDVAELQAARDYMPFIALDPADACPLGGMLVRVTKHPDNPAFLHITYIHLFQNDCGAFGHVGDDEVFGVTVDPSKNKGQGILAIKAISHQGTICEKDTTCGSLPGLTACTTADVGGIATPVVFSSKDKHGSYADLNVCQTQSCFDVCTLPPASASPMPFANAGEPGFPLTSDLTTGGFINGGNGWTEPSLMDFDPWTPGKFGGAGDVSSDLVDASFNTPAQ